jgi:hypothetical protein
LRAVEVEIADGDAAPVAADAGVDGFADDAVHTGEGADVDDSRSALFREDFAGYEEPDIYEILEYARPYLPPEGAFGEMVLNVGKVVYLAKKGAAGIIDISPFTCMNGIVCEAIYPRLSRDLGGIPIRNFYFDGTQSDLDRDLGVYLELARTYQRKKPTRDH